MTGRILLYGATGYTGTLTAELAAQQDGWSDGRLVLAGRSVSKLRHLAEPLDLPWRAFPLEDVDNVAACIEEFDAVLHMAGPFSATSKPMVDACLATGTHYLDITGEIDVYESLAARADAAREAGIVLLPGVGFDVVPSDCLAVHTAARVEAPSRLDIGIAALGQTISQGTLKTAVEGLDAGTRVRRDGDIVEERLGSRERVFDFGRGPSKALAVSWGDVTTAYHSTGIPDITVYFAASRELEVATTVGRYARPLLSTSPAQSVLKWLVGRGPAGPSQEERERSGCVFVAEVRNDRGDAAATRLETPDGYTLTTHTALEAARRVAAGESEPGFQTPATTFGADFVLEFDGVTREDLATASDE